MKTYLTVFSIALLCITINLSKAQSTNGPEQQSTNGPNRNALSFELGKTGLIYNLNFDHRLVNKNFGFRIVMGSNLGQHLTFNVLGGGVYYLKGNTHHFFEAGIDLQKISVMQVNGDQQGTHAVLVYPDYPVATLSPSCNLGYRMYGKRTLLRVGLAPSLIKSEFVPGGYFSFGITF